MKCGCSNYFFLNSANLICQNTDISKYFRESLGLRDNESHLYIYLTFILLCTCRYLVRTAAHPVLRMDPDFREFLEKDGELPKATNTSALSGASVKKLLTRMGDAVEKITFKMDESDEVMYSLW